MIPVATASVSITRQVPLDGDVDADSETDYGVGAAPWDFIATDVRMSISAPSGNRQFGAAGEMERATYTWRCDPLPYDTIQGDDHITDEHGQVFVVLWSRYRDALGISFLEGAAYQQTGEAS